MLLWCISVMLVPEEWPEIAGGVVDTTMAGESAGTVALCGRKCGMRTVVLLICRRRRREEDEEEEKQAIGRSGCCYR